MSAYWLVKSEPSCCSIDMMAKEGTTMWEGVRNYQARNFLMEMKKGDQVLFYHSSEDPVGVAGVVTVAKVAYPDPTQFEKNNQYFDEGATKAKPRWFCPDMKFVKKFQKLISLADMKKEKVLSDMSLLQKGSRLSVHKISKAHFDRIVTMADA